MRPTCPATKGVRQAMVGGSRIDCQRGPDADEDHAPKSLTEMVVVELRKRIIDGGCSSARRCRRMRSPPISAFRKRRCARLCCSSNWKNSWTCCRSAARTCSGWRRIRSFDDLGFARGAGTAAAAIAISRNHGALVERMTLVFDDMRAAFDRADNAAYGVLDGEYHQAMIDLSGNPYISDAYAQVGFRTQALRARLSDEAGLNRISFKDHREMLKLIKARDVASLQKSDARISTRPRRCISTCWSVARARRRRRSGWGESVVACRSVDPVCSGARSSDGRGRCRRFGGMSARKHPAFWPRFWRRRT